MKRSFLASTICAMAFLLAGCAPGQGDLKGAVTFEGKAVCSGYVNVEGGDGIVVGGEIRPDGTYEVKNIGAGKIRLAVYSPDPAEVTVLARRPEEIPPPKDRSKWFPIPEHYSDFAKSDLTFQLSRGANPFNIELKQ